MKRSRRAAIVALPLALLLLTTAACDNDGDEEKETKKAASTVSVVEIGDGPGGKATDDRKPKIPT